MLHVLGTTILFGCCDWVFYILDNNYIQKGNINIASILAGLMS